MSITSMKFKTDTNSENTYLSFLSKEEITLLVKICNMVGDTMMKITIIANIGENNIILPIEDLKPNNYFLKILENDVVYQMTFKKNSN